MKLVIDLPEATYKKICEDIKNGEILGYGERVISRGTPLSKDHGRLIDGDYVLNELSCAANRPVKSQLYIIRQAPTIIPADKSEVEG